MGAVEEAQIREAAREHPEDRLPPETIGIVRAVARMLGIVADDLSVAREELQSHALDDSSTQHALGLVTGMIGVLDALGAPEG